MSRPELVVWLAAAGWLLAALLWLGLRRAQAAVEVARLAARDAEAAKQAAARQMAWMNRAVDGMREGLLVVSVGGELVAWNEAATALVGAEPAAEPMRVARFTRSPDIVEAVESCLGTGTPTAAEVEVRRGTRRRLSVSVTPLMEGQRLVGCVVSLFDRTELHQLERVRQDFVANVSHELRTPVAVIVGWLERITDMTLPDEAREAFLTVQTHASRLQTLVADLLTLSRLESVGLQEGFVETDLVHVVGEAVRALGPLAESKSVGVTVEIDEPARYVQSEPRALAYVVRNLVDNAVKYTPAGGAVAIRARVAEGNQLRIEVTDTGIGIAPVHAVRIFERFYRVDAGRSREMGGTGLGLSIVKHFALALGGDVTVASETGKGSTFTVSLPPESWQAAQESG